MVVVVPGLAPRRDRQPRKIARLVAGVVVVAAEEVTQRVDAERRVVHEEDPGGAAPQQRDQPAADGAGQRHAEPERGGQAEHDPQHERPVDEHDQRVGEQVLGVPALVGHLHVAEHPSQMSVDQPRDRAAPAGAVANVRAVRIAVDVGELVVLAVGGHPVDHRSLGGGGTERGEAGTHEAVALEAAVGQQPVKADGDPRAHDHVAERQDQQVLPRQQIAGPAEPHADPDHDRGDRGDHGAGHPVDERHRHRTHVRRGRLGPDR